MLKYDEFLKSLPKDEFSDKFIQKLYRIKKIIKEDIEDKKIFLNEKIIKSYPDAKFSDTVWSIYYKTFVKETVELLNKTIKVCILEMCQKEKYLLANTFLDSLKDNWGYFDSDIAILHIFLNISSREIKLKKTPIISQFSCMEDIRECYYKLKFLIRRVQYSLPTHLQQELIIYIERYNISYLALGILMTEYMKISNKKKIIDHCKKISKLPFYAERDKDEFVFESIESDKMFSFIICVNDNKFYNEIILYINELNIPEGHEIEIVPVYNAKSMASGYNIGMRNAKGKYKIYIHQDIFIINKNMLFDLLNIFHVDDSIGMVGVAGSKVLVSSGVWWENKERYRIVYQDYILGVQNANIQDYGKDEQIGCVMIDGIFIATSKDIPWREDLFHGFHHYDASQSMEFICAGYRIVIALQEDIWCLHDVPFNKSTDFSYEESRQTFVKEYVKDTARRIVNKNLYVAYHKPFGIISNEYYQSIHVGAALSDFKLPALRDDSQYSISEKNKNYRELTGLYWMWKNDNTSDIVGLCHYCRYFMFIQSKDNGNSNRIKEVTNAVGIEKYFSEYDIILPVPFKFSIDLEEQYCTNYILTDWITMKSVISDIFPEYIDSMNEVFHGSLLYPCNMFVMPKNKFNKYAMWLFCILDELEKKITISNSTVQDRRFSVLSERLLTLYVHHNNMKIKEIPVIEI